MPKTGDDHAFRPPTLLVSFGCRQTHSQGIYCARTPRGGLGPGERVIVALSTSVTAPHTLVRTIHPGQGSYFKDSRLPVDLKTVRARWLYFRDRKLVLLGHDRRLGGRANIRHV